MKLHAIVLFTALLVSACSSSPTSPSASGGGSLGTLHSSADDTPLVVPGILEPNDAPPGWTFVLQGEPHPDYTQSAFFSWRPIAGVGKYEINIDRYDDTPDRNGVRPVNPWKPLPSLFVNSPTKQQAVLPDGSYRARVRSLYPGHDGLWSAYRTQSIPHPPQPAIAPMTGCEWEASDESDIVTLVCSAG